MPSQVKMAQGGPSAEVGVVGTKMVTVKGKYLIWEKDQMDYGEGPAQAPNEPPDQG